LRPKLNRRWDRTRVERVAGPGPSVCASGRSGQSKYVVRKRANCSRLCNSRQENSSCRNDAVPEAAGNQTPQQVNQGQVKQPVAQPKPVLQTIPSESVATSPLQLLGDTELDGTVNQPFDTTYDAEGGLPPYPLPAWHRRRIPASRDRSRHERRAVRYADHGRNGHIQCLRGGIRQAKMRAKT